MYVRFKDGNRKMARKKLAPVHIESASLYARMQSSEVVHMK